MNLINYNHRIAEMNEIAKLSGGKILDKEWKGVNHRYSFELSDGSIKRIFYKNIIRNKLLRKYSERLSPAQNLESIKNIAIKNGGKLLSKDWLGADIPHDFEFNDFAFQCTPKMLKRGQWVPKRGLVSENVCRQALEHLFGSKFIKTQNIIKKEIADRKRPLELDGYCKEFNIAFEYQGHSSHWDKEHGNYLTVSERDLVKVKCCKKLGIKLIIIPSLKEKAGKWSEDSVMSHVLCSIKKSYGKESIPELNVANFKLDFSIINLSKERLDILRKFASDNKGLLISTQWKTSRDLYLFQAKNGKEFDISLSNLYANGWPTDIESYLSHSNGHKKTPKILIQELQDLARKNKGKLLTKEWQGAKFKYLFERENGEQFAMKQVNIKQRGWPK